MIFEVDTTEDTAFVPQAESAVQTGFVFDWENHCYVLSAGSPLEVTGTEAIKEWLRQVIRTQRERFAIYPIDFGAPVRALMGQKHPKGFALSEFRRELTETAAHCPAIRGISSVAYDGTTITCTVSLETEAGVTQEVIDVGP